MACEALCDLRFDPELGYVAVAASGDNRTPPAEQIGWDANGSDVA